MYRRLARSLAALTALAVALAAQPMTWIVDEANGPGTHFTEISAAMLVAQEGDIVLVRPGRYRPFAVSLPLTVRGGPGVRVVGYTVVLGGVGISVTGIGAGKTATLSGLDFRQSNATLGGASLVVRNSPGRVIFEDVQLSPLPGSIHGSEVWISDAAMPGSLDVVSSTVVLANSTLHGITGSFALPSRPALRAADSTVVVSRCALEGAAETSAYDSSSALVLSNTTVTVTDDGTGGLAAGASAVPRSAISGTGALLIDPGVTVTGTAGAPPIAATLNATVRTVPSLRADGPDPAGEIAVDLFSPEGETYLLFLGLPATPVPLPPFGGERALGAGLFEIQNGVQGPSRHAGLTLTVGSYPELIGAPIAWQALSGTYTSRFYLSNPEFIVLRQ